MLRKKNIALKKEREELCYDESYGELLSFSKEFTVQNGFSFDENTWIFLNDTHKTRVNFDFEDLNIYGQKTVNSVKVYACIELNTKKPRTVSNKVNSIKKVIEVTKDFSKDNINLFLAYYDDLNERQKNDLCQNLKNFGNYHQNYNHLREYVTLLEEDASYPVYEKRNRTLPYAKDVLFFDFVVKKHFSEIKNNDEFYYYFPIYFWWRFSNIIPIRVSEMCSIKRNCLLEDKDGYYIKLNRTGDKNKKNVSRVQLIDVIKIPFDLYDETKDYIKQTEDFGYTETLFSYVFVKEVKNRSGRYVGASFKKTVESSFNINILNQLLEQFYGDVVFGKYEGNQADSKVKLGDTRHFAFINLMKQGYDPIQIARLGGHLDLDTQYHYQNHKEFFLDFDFIKFLNENDFLSNEKTELNVSIREKLLNEEKIAFTPDDKAIKLDIGYCFEKNQNCPVDNCFYCPFFKVTFEELNENKDVIEKEIERIDNRIDYLIKGVYDLHQSINSKETTEAKSEHIVKSNMKLQINKSQFNDLINKKEKIFNIQGKVLLNE